MREELFDSSSGMLLDTREYIGEVRDGLDAIFLAGTDERVKNSEVVAGGLVADEEKIRATEGHSPEGSFGDVVVGRDRGEAEESAEFAEVLQQVTDRSAHAGTRFEGASMTTTPAEQSCEERS